MDLFLTYYLRKIQLERLGHQNTYSNFRSLRAQLSLVTDSLPNVFCSTVILLQVTKLVFMKFETSYIKKIVTILSQIRRLPNLKLRYSPLDLIPKKINVYFDASYATNKERTSQLGCFTYLVDVRNFWFFISWISYKSKNPIRPVSGSKIIAFTDFIHIA